MSNNKWSEQEIEQLLSQTPKMKDARSKIEVLTRLKQDQSIHVTPKKSRRWAPSVVAVAAFLTLSLLTVSFLNQAEPALDSASQMEMKMSDDLGNEANSLMKTEKSSDTEITEEAENIGITVLESPDETLRNSVYSNEISDEFTIFRLGLTGEDANSVPVTFLIPKHQIEQDFGENIPTSLELYQFYAPRLDEEELGFSNYHPYKGTFSIEGDSLIHTLPTNHGYDMGSSIVAFKQSLKDTFQEYNQIIFRNEDGSAIEFDQEGEQSKPYNLQENNLYNYFLYRGSNGSEYLTPNFGMSFESSTELTEALVTMKKYYNDIYTSVIPENVTFEVKRENGISHVIFTEPLDLGQMENKAAMNMIEGMLLTGASFGSQLKFENVVQENWNGFDFTQPLPIPIGPNEMPLLLNE